MNLELGSFTKTTRCCELLLASKKALELYSLDWIFPKRSPCVTDLQYCAEFGHFSRASQIQAHDNFSSCSYCFVCCSVTVFGHYGSILSPSVWIIEPTDSFSSGKKNPSCSSFAKQRKNHRFLWRSCTSHTSRIAIRNSRAAIMEARSIPSARTGRRTWGGWRPHPAPSSHLLLVCLPPWPRCSRAGRLQALLRPSLPAAATDSVSVLQGRRRWEAAAWSKHYLWGPVPAFQARWRVACILKKIILIGFVDWPWRLVYLYERVRKFCETLCTQTSNELFLIKKTQQCECKLRHVSCWQVALPWSRNIAAMILNLSCMWYDLQNLWNCIDFWHHTMYDRWASFV